MRKSPKIDATGRRLLQWLNQNCEGLDEVRPLVDELVATASRLAGIRSAIERDGITDAKGRAHPLLSLEVKVNAAYVRIWKTLGLADPVPDGPQRQRGRPPNGERR